MGKKCSFCPKATWNSATSILKLSDNTKDALGIPRAKWELYNFCCTDHYQPTDIVRGGDRNRLVKNAIPVLFERPVSLHFEHSYGQDPEVESEDESLECASQITVKSQLDESGPEDQDDSTYSQSDSEDDMDEDTSMDGPPKESFILTSKTSLLEVLGAKCRTGDCVQPCDVKTSEKGAQLNATMTCPDGHTNNFSSSKCAGDKNSSAALVNIHLTVALFLSGLRFARIKEWCSLMRLQFITETTYYKILNALVYPVVYFFWLNQQLEALAEAKALGWLNIAGDGRYDSPGFCAMYCTYFAICLQTQKILAVIVVNKRQVGGVSTSMEPAALRVILQFLLDKGLDIKNFVSDRSTSIRTMMRLEFPRIHHEFDIWHVVKNIDKMLWKDAKLKGTSDIALWHPSISNMIWWSLETSKGNPDMAREKILSILGHITDTHEFSGFKHFKECAHEALPADRTKPYMKQGSKSVEKVKEALHGKHGQNLDDVDHMTEFLHTGCVESVNSVTTQKYTPKNVRFSFRGMIMRTCAAGLDHNLSRVSEQAVTKDGKPRFKTNARRGGQKWTARPIYSEKDYTWKHHIVERTLECAVKGEVPDVTIPGSQELEASLRPVSELSKDQLIDRHQTRMSMKQLGSIDLD